MEVKKDALFSAVGGTTMRAASFALVAGLAFFAGSVAGERGSAAASIIARVPLIGDGLDATPDTSADMVAFWKAWNTLESRFVLTHASSSLPSVRERMHGAIQGLASSFEDPYTVYLPPQEAKLFTENISGSFAGVGMEIGIRDSVLTVVTPLKGTPAEAAGIRAGDKIIAIDGKTTDGLSVDSAVSRIRGEAGTAVKLTLVRDGEPLEVSITRATIEVPEISEGFVEGANRVYKIALYEFSANSGTQFTRALANFSSSGADKLILDMRGNPGGYLEAAVDTASHFLPRGALVVTEDFDGKEPSRSHGSYGYRDIPDSTKIVVLINQGSASAAEIFAGALQDHGRATIIGERSFGKGSVQTLIPLDDGALKITVARWVTPAGKWIMDNGVTPDIVEKYVAGKNGAEDSQILRAARFLQTGE